MQSRSIQVLILLFVGFGSTVAEIVYITPEYPLLGKHAAPNAIWPQPQQMEASNELLYIKPHALPVDSNLKSCDIIDKAIARYQLFFFPPTLIMHDPPSSSSQILQRLSLNVLGGAQCERYIQLESNETYSLTINQENAVVEANTVWGLLRGLETFSQLVYINAEDYVVINSSVKIIDKPRFVHRGVMFDSARHFIPVSVLKKNLDVMSYNKYNVFHWHLVDDQSFPFESTTYPTLSSAGAFSPDHIYSVADVADVIEHARLRGIRVIPEIDTPGHTYSWGKAMPELLTVCWANGQPYRPIYGVQSDMQLFNPSEPRVYTVMNGLLREIKERFPSNYIHLGMDEVFDPCWRSNPNLTLWMQQMGIQDYVGLYSYYVNQIFNITNTINVKPIVWQDVWDVGVKLPTDTIIHVWKGEDDAWADYIDDAAKQGYKVILSTPWYLNFISYGKYNTPQSVMNLEFFKYYQIEPLMHFTGTEKEKERILGGEACLWGEFVDGTNLLPRFWPRASAVAERLWSPAAVNVSEDAQFRLDVHRCRLLRRGIPAQPILDGYCGSYELGMPRSMVNYPAFNYDIPIWDNVTTVSPTQSTATIQSLLSSQQT